MAYKGKEKKMISGVFPVKKSEWISVLFTHMRKIYEDGKLRYMRKKLNGSTFTLLCL